MIQSIYSAVSNAAPTAAAGVKGPPEVQQPSGEAQERPLRPTMDEYIPEEKREPSGRYWLGKDKDGQPKVYFDAPERDEGGDGLEPRAASGKKPETCTGSTDQVDREIEKLKKEKEQLEQQLNSETDEAKRKELEAKLAQVENELRQKDNDAYRRQHTIIF